MKVVVTGATGHIGINVIRALHEKGFEVWANNRNSQKVAAIQLPPISWIHGDIMDQAFLNKAFEGAAVVVNLAGRISIDGDPHGKVMKTNIQGPANVAEACLQSKVKKLIHFSSIHAYKFSAKDPVINENSPRADETCFKYDQSKMGGERAVQKAVERGLDAVILNPTAVLGPYNYWHSFTGQLFKDLYLGRLPALASASFNWVDARDLADATISAIEKGATGESYILSGHGLDIATIARWVHEFGGKKPPMITVSLGAAKFGLPFLSLFSSLTGNPPLFTRESLATLANYNGNISNEKARAHLDFNPRPIKVTIKDSIEWYQKHGML
jgi:dihydroflavonol-4-reductase